ncbi:MAG TPA: NADH-quinone oxidoreductase subunit I [Euryarchaeota archaeon]|nr:NADH-quinone oxidoreductase subunit I [Euryarchaeota archaeon]
MKFKIRRLSPYIAIKHIFEKPITIRIPKVIRKPAENYRGFHTLDVKKCISCRICERSCPASAIRLVPIKVKEKGVPEIDYGRCTYCQICVDACPTGALQYEERYIYVPQIPERFSLIPLSPDFVRKYKKPYLPIQKIIKTGSKQSVIMEDGSKYELEYL